MKENRGNPASQKWHFDHPDAWLCEKKFELVLPSLPQNAATSNLHRHCTWACSLSDETKCW